MRNAELDEIRALLRAQAEISPEPVRKGLLDGVKSLLKRSAPVRACPLNLTPVQVAPTPVRDTAAPPAPPCEEPALDLTSADHAPMLFLAPRRERFGLAEEGARLAVSEAAPKLKLKPVLETPDDFEPRRRGASLAATEAAGVGPDEIAELHELLSARMPGLLEQVDLDAKLAEANAAKEVATAPQVAAARTSADEAADAWAVASAALGVRPHSDSPLGRRPRLKLVQLAADIDAARTKADAKLARVRRGRGSRSLAA